MANPFRQKPLPALAIGFVTGLDGELDVNGAAYEKTAAVNGQGKAGGSSVLGVFASRQFVKLGNGGMRAPRKSE